MVSQEPRIHLDAVTKFLLRGEALDRLAAREAPADKARFTGWSARCQWQHYLARGVILQ